MPPRGAFSDGFGKNHGDVPDTGALHRVSGASEMARKPRMSIL